MRVKEKKKENEREKMIEWKRKDEWMDKSNIK